MSRDAADDSADDRPTAKVKPTDGSSTLRITPPKPIRLSLEMEEGESWSWFLDPRTCQLYARRSADGLDGLPGDALSLGVSVPRVSGPAEWEYLDLAIPPAARNCAEITAGQQWAFDKSDAVTMRLDRVATGDE